MNFELHWLQGLTGSVWVVCSLRKDTNKILLRVNPTKKNTNKDKRSEETASKHRMDKLV